MDENDKFGPLFGSDSEDNQSTSYEEWNTYQTTPEYAAPQEAFEEYNQQSVGYETSNTYGTAYTEDVSQNTYDNNNSYSGYTGNYTAPDVPGYAGFNRYQSQPEQPVEPDNTQTYSDYYSQQGMNADYTGYTPEDNGYYPENTSYQENVSYQEPATYQEPPSYEAPTPTVPYDGTVSGQTVTPDDDELTPEEIEQERRRKEAIRRRKLAAREERRRKRLQQAIIRCSILLILVVLILVGFVKLLVGIFSSPHSKKKASKTTEEIITTEATTEAIKADIDEAIVAKALPAGREEALALLQQLGETDQEFMDIYDNAAVYPDLLLRNVAVNEEMKQFVIDYPAKISIIFQEDFDIDESFDLSTVPLFLQFDETWGYAGYANNFLGLSGSGPCCLSMAYTYLKQDRSMNPIRVAHHSTNGGFIDAQGNTAWTLMSDGAKNLGLGSEELTDDKDAMIDALSQGNVIICALLPGDFTKGDGYLVIKDYVDGLFYVNDPTSAARSAVGWDYERLSSQIAKMWVISGQDSSTPSEDTSTGSADTGADTNPAGNDDDTTPVQTGDEGDASQSNIIE